MKTNLYYVYGMSPEKRYEAKVIRRQEALKLDRSTLLCGGTFYLGRYGLLYCLPENHTHWEAWAKGHGGKSIQWEDGILRAPNGKVIFQEPAQPLDDLTRAHMRIKQLEEALRYIDTIAKGATATYVLSYDEDYRNAEFIDLVKSIHRTVRNELLAASGESGSGNE